MSDHTRPEKIFSVCVPVYNAEKYLVECIESVLNQADQDTEIILVNDGSKDESGHICDAYARQYPDLIRAFHQSNQGPLAARNHAVKMATGQYLLFLDSDDAFAPDALATIKQAIEQSEADVVLFDIVRWVLHQPTDAITSPFDSHTVFRGEQKKAVYHELTVQENLNSLCRKCIAKRLYHTECEIYQLGHIKQGEDKLVSLVCLDEADTIVYIKEKLYLYRDNCNSTVHNFTLFNYQNLEIVFRYTTDYMKKWELSESAFIQQKASVLSAAVNCTSSLYHRFKKGIGTKEDLTEAVNYIANDTMFIDAYRLGKHFMPRAHRLTTRLILHRRSKILMLWLGTLEQIRRFRK